MVKNGHRSSTQKKRLVLFFLIIFFHLHAFSKDVLVLLPIETNEKKQAKALENALAQGLVKRYDLFHGEDVENQLQIEYKKVDCTAESCAQNLVLHFGGELIAEAVINKVEESYLASLIIRNIITKQTQLSSTETCTRCSLTELISFLKVFGAGEIDTGGFSGALNFANAKRFDTGIIKIEKITPKISKQNGANSSTIYFETDQNDIEVFINDARDKKVENGVFQRGDLIPKSTITITLVKKNYQTRKLQFTLKSGLNKLGTISLKKNTGIFDLQSLPEKADVFIAGEKIGQTPIRVEVEAGKSIIDVKKKNFLTETFSIEIDIGKTTTRVVRLKDNIGYLIVNSIPNDADVSIFNLKTEEIIKAKAPINKEVEAGKYQIKISKVGFSTELFEIDIQNGKTTEITENKASLRELKGVIAISVNPPQKNILIEINDEEVGFAPIEKNLPEGNYLIEAETEDHYAEKTVFLNDQGYQNVVLDLKEKSVFPLDKKHQFGLNITTQNNQEDTTSESRRLTINSLTALYRLSFYPEQWQKSGYFLELGVGMQEYQIDQAQQIYRIDNQQFAVIGFGIKLSGEIFSRYGFRYYYLEENTITATNINNNADTSCDCTINTVGYSEYYISVFDNDHLNISIGLANATEKLNGIVAVSFFM